MKIAPYTWLYQRQIQYYNCTAYDTLTNDIGKILPKFPTDHRHKRGAILASILGSIASSVIGLAYEGISSFLHHKRHKALHKAVAVMDKKTNIQCNRIHHLEDTMIMYGVYNSNTLTDLIDTVHRMQNFTTWNEKTFAGKLHDWMELYSHDEGVYNYAINSVLFLTTVREKYVKMYKRFIEELKLYSKARVLSKGYLPISLLPPSKLEKIFKEVRIAIAKSNKDYDLVLTRLYLCYNMKLVTFGIDNQRNLIVQFRGCVQPYTQKRLIMYQIETVPVPILDKNKQEHSYTELKIQKPYIALNEETYITLHAQELKMCKKIGYEYYCKELFVVKSKTRYSCASTIYFNLESDVIKTNCECLYYYHKMDIKPLYLMVDFRSFWQTGPTLERSCAHIITIF